MKTIWKFEIQKAFDFIVVPVDAKPLWVDNQGDRVFLWCEVDVSKRAINAQQFVQVVGTDWEFEPNGEYFGTVFLDNGLVFHIYMGEQR